MAAEREAEAAVVGGDAFAFARRGEYDVIFAQGDAGEQVALQRQRGGGPGRLAPVAGQLRQCVGGGQRVEFALGQFGTPGQVGEIGKRRLRACRDDARARRRGEVAYLLQAKASGAKVIGLAQSSAEAVLDIQQAAEFGVTPTQKMAPMLLMITETHAVGLKTLQGAVFTESFYWDRTDEPRAWSRRFGRE